MTRTRTRALLWGVLATAMSFGSAAQAAGDCAPFGRMPNYVAQAEAELRNYDAAEFRIAKSNDEDEIVKVAGRACRELKLEVGGHTDNIGGRDYNLKLSEARAAAIVAELVKQGIAANRLRAAGYGPDKPIADNAEDAGRAQNRRVELVKG